MNRAEHCKECRKKLGKTWDCVHAWLDESARSYFPWVGHRQVRHHKEGVERVRQKWGDEAAKAAELHIISDEGTIPTAAEIRKKYGPSPFTSDNGEYPTLPSERPDNWNWAVDYKTKWPKK